MKDIIEKIIEKRDLSFEEAYDIMNLIMEGEINNSLISAFLVGLKIKGESANEVGGFAKAMRENSVRLNSDYNAIDVCGTGGDNSNTFNISTAVAFVVAGTGIKVAKHGNRSISSNSGSSDVLSELGVNINLSKEDSEKALEEIGITFLFAPNYHPAMRYVMPVRRELGFKTVFNILGPLTNPAGTKRQLIGTFSNANAKLMREAAQKLDMEKVCFLCTDNKFDEITLSGFTMIFEFDKNHESKEYSISPETFGYDENKLSDIIGEGPEQNAQIIMNIFNGKDKGPRQRVVIANSAMSIYVAGYSEDLLECKKIAEESILSGKALAMLNTLKEFGGE